MILNNKPMHPAPLLVVVANFDTNGNGINDYDENHPEKLTDKTSDIFGEQWAFSTKEEVYDKFFGAENSLGAYYKELSHDIFWYYPAKIDHPDENTLEEGVVFVNVNEPHPSALRNLEGYTNETAAQKVIADIVKACDPYVDFAKYDSDGDGIVRPTDISIVILNAGFDASSAEQDNEFSKVKGENGPLPSHRYMVHGTSQSTEVEMRGGVKVVRVSNMGEYRSMKSGLMTIGTPAHELAHNLGAQDMYSRWTPPADAEKRWPTPRRFTLMCSGSHLDEGNTPSYLDPYHRVYFGWAEETIADKDGIYTAYSTLSGKYNVLKVTTPNPNEYFICEVRLKEGYDKYIDGNPDTKGGILVWHIDEKINEEWFLKAQCVSSNRPNGKRHDLGNAIRPRQGLEKITDENGNFVKYGPLYADDGGVYDPFFYHSNDEETSTFKSELYCGAASLSYSLNEFPEGVSENFKVHIEVLDEPGNEMRIKVQKFNVKTD